MLNSPGENPVRLLFWCLEGRKFDCALHALLHWILILIQIYSGQSRASGTGFFFCMQPPLTPGSCWWDAAVAERQDGWKGQTRWSSWSCLLLAILVQGKPLLNVSNRNFSKSCQLWVKKHRRGVLVWKISPTAHQSDNYLQPFGHFLSAAFKRVKSLPFGTSVFTLGRMFL